MLSGKQTLNPLARLYPNLVIRKVEAPSIRSLSQERKELPIERPKPTPKPAPKPEPKQSRPQTPEPVPEVIEVTKPVERPTTPKSVTIIEPVKEEIEEPKPTPKPEAKKARPNRASGRVRDMLKGAPSQREDVAPKNGEKGFQAKYTAEQRREQYLERLSRKSVKNAEKEVSQVLEVLDKVNHDPIKLKEEERAIKKKLTLINTARYFVNSSIQEPEPEPEPEPETETDDDDNE